MIERADIRHRLAAFAALAAFTGANWVALVSDPPIGRSIIAALCAVVGATALVATAERVPNRWRAAACAGLIVVAIACLGALALGLPVRLLLPFGWGELSGELGDGIGSLWRADYPYDGGDTWSRLALLLALAPLLALVVALSFWPRRGGGRSMQRCGLVVLLVAYGVAATVSPPSHPLLNGALLFALLAATLWSPALGRRSALLSIGVIGVAALVAIPAAAKLDGSEPWLDYRHWEFGGSSREQAVSFNWNHDYGPLDWSRDGRPLVEIRSAAPHYWSTEVLDHFDGTAWIGSSAKRGVDLPIDAGGDLRATLNTKWVVPLRFEVQALSSQLLVRAGTVLSVTGANPLPVSAQGVPLSSPLEEGDSYSIRAYDPQPSAARMRASEGEYPSELRRYTTVSVPQLGRLETPSVDSRSEPVAATLDTVSGPLRSGPGRLLPTALDRSPYGSVERLAQRLAAGRATAYAVVAAIQRYLQTHYSYSETPPDRFFPLRAFLFRDRIGYCQQFSGAMALMLRMVGIPSRVVGGFAPGERTRGSFSVSDFDAHSWVEVYFNGIGWVTFDPTPPAAPAVARSVQPVVRGRRPIGQFQSGPQGRRLPAAKAAPDRGGSGSSTLGWIALLAALALAVTAALAVSLRRAAQHRDLGPAQLAELQATELRAAAARVGRPQGPGITLRGLEANLRQARKSGAAAYAAHLRRCRYVVEETKPPSSRERRIARRALASGLGWKARLRIWLLMPPLGPTPRRRS